MQIILDKKRKRGRYFYGSFGSILTIWPVTVWWPDVISSSIIVCVGPDGEGTVGSVEWTSISAERFVEPMVGFVDSENDFVIEDVVVTGVVLVFCLVVFVGTVVVVGDDVAVVIVFFVFVDVVVGFRVVVLTTNGNIRELQSV